MVARNSIIFQLKAGLMRLLTFQAGVAAIAMMKHYKNSLSILKQVAMVASQEQRILKSRRWIRTN